MGNDKLYLRSLTWQSLFTRQTSVSRRTGTNVPQQAPLLPPRTRAASCASDDTCSATTLVEFPHQTVQGNPRDCCRGTVIDPSQSDMAIATALSARQADRVGDHEEAARLLVISLRHMVESLDDSACTCIAESREQVSALRMWFEPAHPDMDSCNHRHLVQSEDGPESHVAAAQQRADDNEDAAFARATGGIRTAALFATARALDLLNQLIVLWLVILGNLFAWAAVQFKDSDLPKTIAQYSLYFGAWSYKMCKQWNVHGYAAHLGGYLIAWLSSIDRETGFSCKIICSMAAILGAVARVAEESTRTCA